MSYIKHGLKHSKRARCANCIGRACLQGASSSSRLKSRQGADSPETTEGTSNLRTARKAINETLHDAKLGMSVHQLLGHCGEIDRPASAKHIAPGNVDALGKFHFHKASAFRKRLIAYKSEQARQRQRTSRRAPGKRPNANPLHSADEIDLFERAAVHERTLPDHAKMLLSTNVPQRKTAGERSGGQHIAACGDRHFLKATAMLECRCAQHLQTIGQAHAPQIRAASKRVFSDTRHTLGDENLLYARARAKSARANCDDALRNHHRRITIAHISLYRERKSHSISLSPPSCIVPAAGEFALAQIAAKPYPAPSTISDITQSVRSTLFHQRLMSEET